MVFGTIKTVPYVGVNDSARPVHGTMTSIVPYKLFAAFAAIGKVSPRRDEGIPPYRTVNDGFIINASNLPRRHIAGFYALGKSGLIGDIPLDHGHIIGGKIVAVCFAGGFYFLQGGL